MWNTVLFNNNHILDLKYTHLMIFYVPKLHFMFYENDGKLDMVVFPYGNVDIHTLIIKNY